MICFPIHWQPWCAFWQRNYMVFQLILYYIFIKTYHEIKYKEDLKSTLKRCVLEMICFSLWFWLWCAFYNRSLKKHIILLSKCTSRLANKRIHIKLVSSDNNNNNKTRVYFPWAGVGWSFRNGYTHPILKNRKQTNKRKTNKQTNKQANKQTKIPNYLIF